MCRYIEQAGTLAGIATNCCQTANWSAMYPEGAHPVKWALCTVADMLCNLLYGELGVDQQMDGHVPSHLAFDLLIRCPILIQLVPQMLVADIKLYGNQFKTREFVTVRNAIKKQRRAPCLIIC